MKEATHQQAVKLSQQSRLFNNLKALQFYKKDTEYSWEMFKSHTPRDIPEEAARIFWNKYKNHNFN